MSKVTHVGVRYRFYTYSQNNMTWGQVKNLGYGGDRLDLIYSKLRIIISVDYAINYPGVNYFQPYADPKFGMQYSG